MRVNSKQIKINNVASTKDIKEIALAKISTKQAIIVAIISLLSAIAVTMIANLDKIRNTKNIVTEETGYYEGRASIVESAFREKEEEIQSMSQLAQLEGRPQQADRLNDLNNEIQRSHVKFQELHTKHIDAIINEKRLNASKLRAEANELIREANRRLEEIKRLGQEVKRKEQELESIIFRLIPNYGKRPINIQDQVNNAD